MNPETILIVIVLVALSLYAVLGGADFGAGVWELNRRFRSSETEKRLLYRAIGPVWEANHVWIIFVIVLLFGAFPPAFAAICQTTWVALFFVLIGIVFRGAAYAFRSPTQLHSRKRRVWEAVFGIASTLAPFSFGVAIGQLISGDVDASRFGSFAAVRILPLFFGFYAVGVCVYLAASFLTREAVATGDSDLAERWRRRSIGVGLVVGAMSLIGLGVVQLGAPFLMKGLLARGWPFVGASIGCGIASVVALRAARVNWAAILSSGAVICVVFGWGAAQYPYIVFPDHTIDSAKVPDSALWPMLVVVVGGAVLLLPSLIWLFVIFKRNEP